MVGNKGKKGEGKATYNKGEKNMVSGDSFNKVREEQL